MTSSVSWVPSLSDKPLLTKELPWLANNSKMVETKAEVITTYTNNGLLLKMVSISCNLHHLRLKLYSNANINYTA